jgi:hypothetical protein
VSAGNESAPRVPAPQPTAVAAPAARDPLWHAPLFVLAPARSHSSIATAMLGQHPQLCAFPELLLFRSETVAGLLRDPPGWRGVPALTRISGLCRALAQHHDGEQTEATVATAADWLRARRGWSTADVLDHLLDAAAPRIGVEKSPENASRDDYLTRLNAAYPRARYIHLTRHPVPSVRSMHHHWSGLDYWTLAPDLFHHFCLGVWTFQHRRIHTFVSALPADRRLTVRSEDLLNDPQTQLPRICAWLGIDAGAEAIEAMSHPERSPYARIGPPDALGGGDSGFLREPALRATQLPASLDVPADWQVDPWSLLSAMELAQRLGYEHAG